MPLPMSFPGRDAQRHRESDVPDGAVSKRERKVRETAPFYVGDVGNVREAALHKLLCRGRFHPPPQELLKSSSLKQLWLEG